MTRGESRVHEQLLSQGGHALGHAGPYEVAKCGITAAWRIPPWLA
jgi:hypothetical protein